MTFDLVGRFRKKLGSGSEVAFDNAWDQLEAPLGPINRHLGLLPTEIVQIGGENQRDQLGPRFNLPELSQPVEVSPDVDVHNA